MRVIGLDTAPAFAKLLGICWGSRSGLCVVDQDSRGAVTQAQAGSAFDRPFIVIDRRLKWLDGPLSIVRSRSF